MSDDQINIEYRITEDDFARFTWRMWGGVLGEWAEVAWGSVEPPWYYLDFYDSHLRWMIETYPAWSQAVLSVLAEQDRRLREALGV